MMYCAIDTRRITLPRSLQSCGVQWHLGRRATECVHDIHLLHLHHCVLGGTRDQPLVHTSQVGASCDIAALPCKVTHTTHSCKLQHASRYLSQVATDEEFANLVVEDWVPRNGIVCAGHAYTTLSPVLP